MEEGYQRERQTNLQEFKFPIQKKNTGQSSRLRYSNLLLSSKPSSITQEGSSSTKITNISVNSNHKFLCASTNKGI